MNDPTDARRSNIDPAGDHDLGGHQQRVLGAVPLQAQAVRVTGDSRLAEDLRQAFRTRTCGPLDRPDVVIDTTGRPTTWSHALEDLHDRGLLVLAATPAVDCWRLDPYPDLHLRGLTVRAITPDSDGDGSRELAGA